MHVIETFGYSPVVGVLRWPANHKFRLDCAVITPLLLAPIHINSETIRIFTR